MTDQEFVNRVYEQAQLDDRNEALRAIYATLSTLRDYLQPQHRIQLAVQLPTALARHLRPFAAPTIGRRYFNPDGFFERVAKREGAELADAIRHARAVIVTLNDVVADGEIADLCAQLSFLPYGNLFSLGSPLPAEAEAQVTELR